MANPSGHEADATPGMPSSEHDIAPLPAMTVLAARAFASWLAAGDAQPSLPEQVRHARALCGQYLALRRKNEGLSAEQVRRGSGLPPLALFDLETGQGAPQSFPDEVWYRLCLMLNPTADELDFIGAVVHIALGRSLEPHPLVMQHVLAYVEQALSEVEAVPAASVPATPQTMETEVLSAEPLLSDVTVLQILRALKLRLHQGADVPTIQSIIDNELETEPSLSLVRIPYGLRKLRQLELVERMPHDPELFALTPAGQEYIEKVERIIAMRALLMNPAAARSALPDQVAAVHALWGRLLESFSGSS
jgi:hypothetical protein